MSLYTRRPTFTPPPLSELVSTIGPTEVLNPSVGLQGVSYQSAGRHCGDNTLFPQQGRSSSPQCFLKIHTNTLTAHHDIADLAAMIAGVVSALLLLLISIIAVLLWCLSRQKGSYVTNETDDDDELDDDDDDESVASDKALPLREPLRLKADQ